MNQYTLMPRLSPTAARQQRIFLWESDGVMEFDRGVVEDAVAAPDAFPSTGGAPATVDELLRLREALLEEVSVAPQSSMADFDLALGRALFTMSSGQRAEFAHPQVWDFLALALLPDLATRRIRSSQTAPSRKSFQDRLIGGNRRHVMERLWKRWVLFGPEIVESRRPSEDLYAAILERPSLWRNPAVARIVMEKFLAEGTARGEKTGEGYRQFIMPIRAATGFADLTTSDVDCLRSVVDHQYQEASEPRGRDVRGAKSSTMAVDAVASESLAPVEFAPESAPQPTARRRPTLRRLFGGR